MIQRFKILATLLLTILLSAAFAQGVTLSGIIEASDPLPDTTRIGIFQVDSHGVWGEELDTTAPLAGTFTLTLEADDVDSNALMPFIAGSVRLPGLLSEYRVEPNNVNYTLGRVNVYLDNNQSGQFEREGDGFLVGIASLEEPQGYFNLIYVDQDVMMVAEDITLELKQGWNIYAFRLADESNAARFAIVTNIDDVLLSQFVMD